MSVYVDHAPDPRGRMNALATLPQDDRQRAQADALDAAIGGVMGVPGRVIAAFVAAQARRREPVADMVRAWFGPIDGCGPGAWDAARRWAAALQAVEARQAARPAGVATPAAAPHLAAMRDDDSQGVPLAHYIEQHRGVAVSFHCRACAKVFDVPIADVVAGLKARREGDERTGIRAVGRFARKPCAACGALDFETRPLFPPTKPATT